MRAVMEGLACSSLLSSGHVADKDAPQLVDLTLELTNPTGGETVSLNTRVRVGGAL